MPPPIFKITVVIVALTLQIANGLIAIFRGSAGGVDRKGQRPKVVGVSIRRALGRETDVAGGRHLLCDGSQIGANTACAGCGGEGLQRRVLKFV